MIFMTFVEVLSWINQNLLSPIFNFQLSFAGGVSFGAIVVAVFGLPLVVACFKKLF